MLTSPSQGVLGPYANTSALISANPASNNVGKTALVGSVAPYTVYSSDGTSWSNIASKEVKALKYPHFRKAVATARVNQGRATIAFIGDSTMQGVAATRWQDAWPYQLSNLLPANMNVKYNAAIGGAAFSGIDPRVTMGAGWSLIAGADFSTGDVTNSTTINPLTFTPANPVDTFALYVATNSVLGTFTYSVNGGSTTTFNQNTGSGTRSYQKIVISVTKGINTLSIQRVSGAVYLFAIDAYDSTTSDVNILNFGTLGKKTSDFAVDNGSWSPLQAPPAFAPALTIISLGYNDMAQSVSVATYKANMQTLITQWGAYGDVLLVAQPQGNSTWAPYATQDSFYAAVRSLAESNGLPLVDMYKRWGTFPTLQSLGFIPSDVHPGSVGYADYAQALNSELSSI